RLVLSEICEPYGRASASRAPFAAHRSRKSAASLYSQTLQFFQEGGIKKAGLFFAHGGQARDDSTSRCLDKLRLALTDSSISSSIASVLTPSASPSKFKMIL